MGRPTDEERISKGLEKSYRSLRDSYDNNSADHLKVRELVFCRLIAEQGETQRESYRVAFKPESATDQSIDQMASKVAARPRVKAEIERIRREISEHELKKEERLAIALDGPRVSQRMAIELFCMATSSSEEKVKLAAWKMLGEMKHVDAFAKSGAVVDSSTLGKVIGITASDKAGDAKRKLIESVGNLIASRLPEKVIDVAPVEKEEDVNYDYGK